MYLFYKTNLFFNIIIVNALKQYLQIHIYRTKNLSIQFVSEFQRGCQIQKMRYTTCVRGTRLMTLPVQFIIYYSKNPNLFLSSFSFCHKLCSLYSSVTDNIILTITGDPSISNVAEVAFSLFLKQSPVLAFCLKVSSYYQQASGHKTNKRD